MLAEPVGEFVFGKIAGGEFEEGDDKLGIGRQSELANLVARLETLST